MPSRWLAVALVVANLIALPAHAEPDEPDLSGELPRIAPVEASDALSTFQVADGFRLKLAAAEPLVHDPVAMSFDERGRLYVIEMCDYSEQDRDFLGVVRLLEDTNGDGVFDRSSAFADKFSWPTAVICYDGGVFVGAAPDIWYLKDTDSDGSADERKKVFTGFGRDNVQGLLNSFAWGLDNRIYGATSASGGDVRRADTPDAKPVALRGRDFAFDPRTLELTAESGGAQHGLTFDDWGRRFVCSNSDHIQLIMFDDHYAARNPNFPAPNPRVSIASDGPQAEVYRISPIEPWRIVRTRLRVSGAVPGIVEGGGRAAGYFTSATGVTIYRGDAWPQDYRGNAFIGDVGSNVIHRKRLEPAGVGLAAHRADSNVEFVASRDIWFRPAQFANGPDGNLYISDVYREVIEHPASLPPVIKKHLDLTSGRDRGRIYRLASNTSAHAASKQLAGQSVAELVATLEHPNSWHRETAARLLFERQDQTAVPLLTKLAQQSPSPLGRLHALYALEGAQALNASLLKQALADQHPRVREHAIKLSEPFATESSLVQQLTGMTDDEDPRVRYQLAFTLGELPVEQRVAPLAKLAASDGADRWMGVAIQTSLAEGAAEFVVALLKSGAQSPLLRDVTLQIGRAGQVDAIASVLERVASASSEDRSASTKVLLALAEGYGAARLTQLLTDRQLTGVQTYIDKTVGDARRAAFDRERSAETRVAAIEALELAPPDASPQAWADLLDPREPQAVQLAALNYMGRSTSEVVATTLLEAWPRLAPNLRGPALEILLARPERVTLLLDAMADGTFSARELDAARKKQLATHRDVKIRERAETLLANAAPAARADVMEAYRSATTLSGDAAAGKQLFAKTCAACHKLEGVGHEIGPNLATIQNRGAEAILTNVIDPNREVNPQYLSYLVVTDDGRTLTGMVQAETATSITLTRAENQSDLILRNQIESMESTGVSLMPEGLEKDVTPQGLADLIAYLLSVK